MNENSLLAAKFQTSTDHLDWGGLYTAAKASALIYQTKLENTRPLLAAGFQLEWLLTKYVEGLVAIRDDQALVVFRGSDNFEDWSHNFSAMLKRVKLGDETHAIHRGFLESYLPLHEQILDALDGFTGQVILAGHSLGGAKAMLCAHHLLDETDFNPLIYTFGQPRVGDAKYAEFVDASFGPRYVRVVNQADMVPLVPTHWAHGGREIFFNAKGEIGPRVELFTSAFQQALDSAPLLKKPWGPEFFAELKQYYGEYKQDVWKDIVERFQDPVSKATAPWITFHDPGRYAANVLRAGAGAGAEAEAEAEAEARATSQID